MHTSRALHVRRACNCVAYSTEATHFRQRLHKHANGTDRLKVCTTSAIYIHTHIYIGLYQAIKEDSQLYPEQLYRCYMTVITCCAGWAWRRSR